MRGGGVGCRKVIGIVRLLKNGIENHTENCATTQIGIKIVGAKVSKQSCLKRMCCHEKFVMKKAVITKFGVTNIF
jgi:hypothetical protein